jgi:hypothetical protein
MSSFANQISAFCSTAKPSSSGPMPFDLATAEEIKTRYGPDHFRDYLINHNKEDYVLPQGIEPPAAKPDADATPARFDVQEGIAAFCGTKPTRFMPPDKIQMNETEEPAVDEPAVPALVVPAGFLVPERDQGPVPKMIDQSEWRR